MGKGRYDDMDMKEEKKKVGRKPIFSSLFVLLILLFAFLSWSVFKDTRDDDLLLMLGKNPLLSERYEMKKGETLSSIASERGLSPMTLESVNGKRSVEEGSEIIIPESDGLLYYANSLDDLSSYLSFLSNAPSLSLVLIVNDMDESTFEPSYVFIPLEFSSGEIPEPEVMEEEAPLVSDDVVSEPLVTISAETEAPAVSASGFVFPLETVSEKDDRYSFGSLYDGVVLEGNAYPIIPGEGVVAISDGTVIRAGSEEKRGRYLTIRHEDGFESTYYSLETIYVTISDNVKKGDTIASIGRSSDYFPSPMLFFVLTKDGVAVDPDEYL